MILKLKYGKGTAKAEYRAPRQFAELKSKYIATLQKPEDIITQALDKPIGTYPFAQLFRNAGSVLIVVPEDLHYSGVAVSLPVLLKRLMELGVRASDLCILVSGMWGARRNGIHALLDSELGWRGQPQIVYHDASNTKGLEYVGQTRRGTPVFVNRLLIDSENVILCGRIDHLSYAGYAGGPSAIVPDCAGRETIVRNLSLILDPASPRIHPRCYDGVIEGNPLQEDMREAFRFITVDFLLHTVLNDYHSVIGAVGGEPLQAHAAGCHFLDDVYRVPISHLADLVIVSCGGHPHDLSYISAHRALHHAVHAARPGGVVLLVAECSHGLGSPNLLKWLNHFSPARTHASLLRHHDGDGITALSTMQKARDLHIIALTNLDPEAVRTFGFTPVTTLREGLQLAHERLPNLNSCYVLPNGSTTVPYLL